MQHKNLIASAVLTISAFTMPTSANAQDVLTGDTRLACEALLCLASGTRPTECAPSLRRYFSISFRRFNDTIRGRTNFLNLCPASKQTPQMQSFASAVANGSGRCDAVSLNVERMVWTGGDGNTQISNQLPDYCSAYIGNTYSNLGGETPKYVGIPERGGYWVAARNHDAALADYNARIAAEEEAKRRGNQESGS
jgi:hypothetical protein